MPSHMMNALPSLSEWFTGTYVDSLLAVMGLIPAVTCLSESMLMSGKASCQIFFSIPVLNNCWDGHLWLKVDLNLKLGITSSQAKIFLSNPTFKGFFFSCGWI